MNLKKLSVLVAASALTLGSLVMTPVVQASALDDARTNAGLAGGDLATSNPGATSLPELVARIISVILGFIGVLLFVYFFYAGFLWMTAGGEAEKIKKAKGILMNATIGLVIVLASYTISTFVLDQLIKATVTP